MSLWGFGKFPVLKNRFPKSFPYETVWKPFFSPKPKWLVSCFFSQTNISWWKRLLMPNRVFWRKHEAPIDLGDRYKLENKWARWTKAVNDISWNSDWFKLLVLRQTYPRTMEPTFTVSSKEPRKKPSYVPLDCLVYRDPYFMAYCNT